MSLPPQTPTPPRSAGRSPVALYSDVEKSGYLTKRSSGRRRYFVLRGADAARLECHMSRESWLGKGPSVEEEDEGAVLGPLSRLARWFVAHLRGLAQCLHRRPRQVLSLSGLVNVVERSDERCPHGLALLTDSAYVALGAPDRDEQRAWVSALLGLVAPYGAELRGPWRGLPPPGCGPEARLRDAWQGELLYRGLGVTRLRAGPCRVFFYGEELRYVSPASGPGTDATSVMVSLFCVKCYGHIHDCFFVTLGDSSDLGVGQIWVRLEDSAMASAVHRGILLALQELSRPWSNAPPKLCPAVSTSSMVSRARTLPPGQAESGPCPAGDAPVPPRAASPPVCDLAPFPRDDASPSAPEHGRSAADAPRDRSPSDEASVEASVRVRLLRGVQGTGDGSPPPPAARRRVGGKAARGARRAGKASSAFFSAARTAEAEPDPGERCDPSPTALPSARRTTGGTGDRRSGADASDETQRGPYVLMQPVAVKRCRTVSFPWDGAGDFSGGGASGAEGAAWRSLPGRGRACRSVPRYADYTPLPPPAAARVRLPSTYTAMAPGVSGGWRGDRRASGAASDTLLGPDAAGGLPSPSSRGASSRAAGSSDVDAEESVGDESVGDDASGRRPVSARAAVESSERRAGDGNGASSERDDGEARRSNAEPVEGGAPGHGLREPVSR